MRGRKPKPLGKADQDGDTRKVGARKFRAKIAAEPKAVRGLPDCPRHLKGRARAAWNFWREELEGMGLDRRPDAQMLEGACVNYSRAVESDLIVARDGIMQNISTIDKESGEPILLKSQYHPAITVSNAAWRQVRAFCSEFGLSPVSRTRLAVEKPDSGADDLAKILMQPRAPRQTTTVQ
jgi:P27 family predicted phage terminase small subunit